MRASVGVAMAIALCAVASAHAQQPNPPEVVETLPAPAPPPPMIIPAPAATPARLAQPQREVAIDVRVLGGTDELWNRRLTLRGYNGAQLTLEVAEATACPGDNQGGYEPGRRTGLRLQLSQRGSTDRFSVNASWTRRAPDCEMPGTLTSGVDVTVPLAPGQSRTVTGDGGLKIVLSRPR